MARPPKDPAQVASIVVSIRMRPAVHEQLTAKAHLLGLPLSQMLVKVAMAVPLPRPVPAVNRHVALELARIGTNLNQLAHAANSGASVGVDPAELVVLAQTLRRFREDLYGRAADEQADPTRDR